MHTAVIENIQRFCMHDGPGIRSVVFFKGCPLRCLWCSNPTTQKHGMELLHHAPKCLSCGYCLSHCPEGAVSAREGGGIALDRTRCRNCGDCVRGCMGKAMRMAGRDWDVNAATAELLKDMNYYRNSGGGVTLSGGEVLSHTAFALELCAALKAYGVHLAMETSGFGRCGDLLALAAAVDYIFYDIKHLDSAKHEELTGQDNRIILENFTALAREAPQKLTVRLPLVPGCNDAPEHLEAFGAWLAASGVLQAELLPYHRLGKGKYELLGRPYALESLSPVPDEDFRGALETVRAHCGKTTLLGG